MAMFGTSWRVGRIAGIEIRVDSSWVVIALLITYSMYLQVSQQYREATSCLDRWRGRSAIWPGPT